MNYDDPTEDFRIRKAIDGLDRSLKEDVLISLKSAKKINAEDMFESSDFRGDIQQGDILLNMPVFDIKNQFKEIKSRPVIVLSNTCDLVRSNKRAIRLVYTPILKFSLYKEKLRKESEDEDQLNSYLGLVKKQRIDKLVYVPDSVVGYEGLLALDYVLSVPVEDVLPEDEVAEKWAASMSLPAWFMLAGKITTTFYRPTEDQILYRLGIKV